MGTSDPAQIMWTLQGSGLGTGISGAGNSGAWSNTNPSFETLFDLRFIDDLGLFVYVGSIASSPSFKVNIDGYDDAGNLFSPIASTAAITGAGASAPVYVGRHGGAVSNYVVLPQWGRVSWTCTGGSCAGVEISVIGR